MKTISLLSPTIDYIFKQLFGEHRNIEFLVAFLKAVLHLSKSDFEKLTIVDPHLKKRYKNEKVGILDVKVQTKTGLAINVEIQVAPYENMREGLVFCASRMFYEQAKSELDYKEMKQSICILITNWNIIKDSDTYHNIYQYANLKTGKSLSSLSEIHILELPKLPKQSDRTELWDWLKFLNSTKKEEFDVINKKNMTVGKAVGVLMKLSADERVRLIVQAQEDARRDEISRYL
jgi:predicted transposase/invertase (TIGR01784 family)